MQKRYLLACFLFLTDVTVFAQNMQPGNLIKTPLANLPEDAAILKNPLMYGEGNAYGGAQVQGAIQIISPLADYMFDIEGTIMRFNAGSQEKIRFHLNAYGWSGSGTINYSANPVKAYWDCSSTDLKNLPVTIGNIPVNGSLKTAITIGEGSTVWGSCMMIAIDKVYLSNMPAYNYLYDDSKWSISKVAQLNSTDNQQTTFTNQSADKLNFAISVDENQNIGIGTATPQEKP